VEVSVTNSVTFVELLLTEEKAKKLEREVVLEG